MSHVAPLEAASKTASTADTAQPAGAAQNGSSAAKARTAARNSLQERLGLAGPSSLARRFLLASLAVLLAGGVTIGVWVGDQLERGIIARTASITALYVGSFIEPHLATLATGEWLTDADKTELDALLTGSEFSQDIVALKVWRPDGAIMYSPDRELIGQQFPIDDDLQAALDGQVTAHISTLEADENVSEREHFDRLLEMYIPVRESGSDRIIAAAEFYQRPNEIEREVGDARLSSWLVVAGAVSVAYLLLFGIVRQGSDTIVRQQRALEAQVSELSALLTQNEQLRDRVRAAAERTTTLSERNLRRISADLHDGPGQMLALAMLRLDRLRSRPEGAPAPEPMPDQEFQELKGALTDALRDMRAIAAGLRLPELNGLTAADAARRAVDDHVRRTGTPVELRFDGPDADSAAADPPLPTKIAMYRALQELLSNSTRHGGGNDVAVRVANDGEYLRLTVSDRGPGFAPERVGTEGHLGLAGIREQAELLGGTFEVESRNESGASPGATVTVSWPL